MKQEELKNNALSDEELGSVAGGASSPEQLTYAFEPGTRVRCSVPRRQSFDGEIVSKTFVRPDPFDREFFAAYEVMPDGGTATEKVSECFMQRI